MTGDSASLRDPEAGAARLPASLAPCFQEYRLASLDLDADCDLVVERVLAYGNREEVRWLLETYGRPVIVAWLRESGARRLPRRRLVLWSVVLAGGDPPPPRPSGGVAWPH